MIPFLLTSLFIYLIIAILFALIFTSRITDVSTSWMHYGDSEQVDNNILSVVVYTHTTDFGVEPIIDSIQECKYFPKRHLINILNHPENYLDRKQLPDDECWYFVSFKHNGEMVEVVDVLDVSEKQG